jgi:hypothetical protein
MGGPALSDQDVPPPGGFEQGEFEPQIPIYVTRSKKSIDCSWNGGNRPRRRGAAGAFP